LAAILILILIASAVAAIYLTAKPANAPNVYVGMNIAFGGEETAISLVDTVSSYVNLIILGSLNLTTDTAALGRVCDHITKKGLNFIVYVGLSSDNSTFPPAGPNADFFRNATQKYADKFLGVYMFDEAGGKLIDGAHSVNETGAKTYTEAASKYINGVNFYLKNYTAYYQPPKLHLYTSDYALYWYDYLSGYSTVFAEFVGSGRMEIQVGLCRGAASTLHKDWGAMLTWSNYTDFIDNPQQIFSDMVTAYQNGAKYIAVFNSATNNTQAQYGGLTGQHLQAMKDFWEYKKTATVNQPANVAYVLPADYGYDFRGPNGNLWYVFAGDSRSNQIWNDLNQKLTVYDSKMDIVYETLTGNHSVTLPYSKLIYWNGTMIEK
jgi:hypothetical protein